MKKKYIIIVIATMCLSFFPRNNVQATFLGEALCGHIDIECEGNNGTCDQLVLGCWKNVPGETSNCISNICGICETRAENQCSDGPN